MDLWEHAASIEKKPNVLSVCEVARLMREALTQSLGSVQVEGEISNLRKQSSGHIYFTLKDAQAQLSCAFFRGNARFCKIDLSDGIKVVLNADVDFYESRGQVQLIVRSVSLAGEGDLQRKFEELKRRLEAEGLFAESRKKTLPAMIGRVGLITSGTGAALQDMLNVFSHRAPWMKLYLWPVAVQGVGAENEIARAIERWGSAEFERYALPKVDVLLVARGGGSLEDLWNFNEEIVVRAIAGSLLPVVTGIGHEIDFTLADFAADLRAPTPSAAAERISPDGEAIEARIGEIERTLQIRLEEMLEKWSLKLNVLEQRVKSGAEYLLIRPAQKIDDLERDLTMLFKNKIGVFEQNIFRLEQAIQHFRPKAVLDERAQRVESKAKELDSAIEKQMLKKTADLRELEGILRVLGPDSIFERGFSILFDSTGKVVNSVKQISPGLEYLAQLKDGQAKFESK